MKQAATIALLGTGLLGRAMAERLRAVGHVVIAYNRTAAKALPLEALGITVVGTPELAVAQAEYVLLVLSDAAAIRSVMLSPACSAALRGKTIIQMGTIASSDSSALQRDVEGYGASYCEAPVLGSQAEATSGTLLVMVGAAGEQFARVSPLLRSLGRKPRLIGPVGTAAALKLALNQLIAAEISAFALSVGLVQRSGVSVDTFMGILRDSALFAPTFDKKLPRLLKRDYHQPNFSTCHLLKDVELFLGEATGRGLQTGTLEGVRMILKDAIARGLGDLDYSALYERINPPGNAPKA